MLPRHALWGLAAAVAGTLAAAVVLWGASGWALLLGAALHVLGVMLALRAARAHRDGQLGEVERQSVWAVALLVPALGPALAWKLPRRRAERVENAHEIFERYSGHVEPEAPEHERTLFTGDHDADLARELDAESHVEVLRHGSTNQKRNALARLADLGEPRHLRLIRNCLVDPDPETRLYAYGELERLTRHHELRIAACREASKAEPDAPARHRELGEAHHELAASGLLDGPTAEFHLRVAARSALAARRLDAGDVEATLLEAQAHAELGDVDGAEDGLDDAPHTSQDHPDVIVARAELAYRRRDFVAVRRAGEALRARGRSLPDWISALCDGGLDGEDARPPGFQV